MLADSLARTQLKPSDTQSVSLTTPLLSLSFSPLLSTLLMLSSSMANSPGSNSAGFKARTNVLKSRHTQIVAYFCARL